METPEQILIRYTGCDEPYSTGMDKIISAMKEYARQVREAQIVLIGDELPERAGIDSGFLQPHVLDCNRFIP